MTALLDGRKVASTIKECLRKEIALLKEKGLGAPTLVSLCVGEDCGTTLYAKVQAQCALETGIDYRLIGFEKGISKNSLIAEIEKLNNDPSVHGVIVQTPLPLGMKLRDVISFCSPLKDAEGMHPENLGHLLLENDFVVPCTAQACMDLLKSYKIKLYGREVVIVGHSEIVGKPLSLLMLKNFATTTVCHIATFEAKKLRDHVKRAQILIVAVGKAHLIKGAWIKKGAVVVDVGINRLKGKIVGDVEFEAAAKRASFITPVPGGIGPLTVLLLMKNTLELFKRAKGVS